ncbi:hypothetical protein [Vibrio phage vB_VpaS_CHI]|nr:hypothetical protein [Vibrio phage vB_VpaS_ALK]USL90137.1 hypothetical protein [Vibrio phage vB_VpaS_CHI]
MSGIKCRHLRHRSFNRVRHSKRMKDWLATQGTRLEKTPEEVFELLKTNTAAEVEAMPTPPPPPPEP